MNYAGISTLYVSQKDGAPWLSGFTPERDAFGNGPLNSIEKAIEKVCQVRATGNFRPMTIRVLDEEYYLDKPLQLIPDDRHCIYRHNDYLSGITFEGPAKIIGGKRLSGFAEDVFNGQKCFSLYIPEVKEGKWTFTDLFVNGQRAKMTRYPAEGTLRCIDTECPDGIPGEDHFNSSKWFIAHKEDLENVSGIEDAIVSFYHYWIDEHSPVESYDPETGKLTMAYRSRFMITNRYDDDPGCTANLHYYLENVPEMFKNPDEWYLDNANGMLYYIPRDESCTLDTLVVYAPTVDRIVDICGLEERPVCDIRFRNLTFICSKGDYASVNCGIDVPLVEGATYGSDAQSVAGAHGAINFKYAKRCAMENCSLENLGVHGISVDAGCSDIRIEKCTIRDIGAGGIRIFGGAYGSDAAQETHHITVKDCDIAWCGRRYAAGCGILANHTYGNEFVGNEISYLDYSGISVGWVWGYGHNITCGNLIRNNHIHHIGMGNLSDMGGIYLLGKQRGTVVSGNLIHDVICKHYGGWGIYTDEGSSYITIENNKVYNTSSNCYHQHYGSDNVIRGNVFYGAGDSLVRCSVSELHACLVLENNVLITDGNPMFSTREAENGYNPGVLSDNNRIWDVSGGEPVAFEVNNRKVYVSEARQLGIEKHSVVTSDVLAEMNGTDGV